MLEAELESLRRLDKREGASRMCKLLDGAVDRILARRRLARCLADHLSSQ